MMGSVLSLWKMRVLVILGAFLVASQASFESVQFRTRNNSRFLDAGDSSSYRRSSDDRNLPSEVTVSLDAFRNRRYVYPKSSIHESYNSEARQRDSFNRKHYFDDFNDDLVKFSEEPALQSDYGDFVNYNDNYYDNTENVYINKFHDYLTEVQNNNRNKSDIYFNYGQIFRRPKFKTKPNQTSSPPPQFSSPSSPSSLLDHGLNFDQKFLSGLNKYNKYSKLNASQQTENVNEKVHDILTKYLVKLHRRKKKKDGVPNRPEDVDVVGYTDDDVNEAVENTASVDLPQDERFYGNLETYPKIFFNDSTKTKFIDNAKLYFLKNNTAGGLFNKNKFLSLFTIINFPNSPCQTSNSMDYYEGTCYHSSECQALNGTAMGTCANGYGVCCVFIGTCGATSGQNCTYFQSPNYPNYYPSNGTVVPPPPLNGTNPIDPRLRYQLVKMLARQESTVESLSCIFQIQKASDNVRQLRIDFVDMELRGPTNGTCVVERLVISGQNSNDLIPALCGYNSGQHVYVDVTDVSGPIQLAVLSNTVERKRFRIRVCQIDECTNPLNCLQYFTGLTGIITSFNYDQAASLSRSVPGYFNNLNYAICIRKASNYCSITYSVLQNGTFYPFQISNVDENGQNTVPPGQAGAEIFSCPDDYIVINGIRLCGSRLNDGSVNGDFTANAPVTDTSAGPFIIPVRTDSMITGRGFKLYYMQNRCPNT